MIPEEDMVVDALQQVHYENFKTGGSSKRMKSWDEICKGLSQWIFNFTYLEVYDILINIAKFSILGLSCH